MSVSSSSRANSISNGGLLWGGGIGLALFGSVTATAVLANRFAPTGLSRSSVKFLTSPLSGGLTALGLISGGALIGKLCTSGEAELSSSGEDELSPFAKYLPPIEIEDLPLSGQEQAVVGRQMVHLWYRAELEKKGEEALISEVRKLIAKSGQCGEEAVEPQDIPQELVDGFIEWSQTEPPQMSGELKRKLIASRFDRTDQVQWKGEKGQDSLSDEVVLELIWLGRVPFYALHHGTREDLPDINQESGQERALRCLRDATVPPPKRNIQAVIERCASSRWLDPTASKSTSALFRVGWQVSSCHKDLMRELVFASEENDPRPLVEEVAHYVATTDTPTHLSWAEACFELGRGSVEELSEEQIPIKAVFLARYVRHDQEVDSVQQTLCRRGIHLKREGGAKGVTREEVQAAIDLYHRVWSFK